MRRGISRRLKGLSVNAPASRNSARVLVGRLVATLLSLLLCFCLDACGVAAIFGEKKKPHEIDGAKCIRCGKCLTVCNQGAIEKR